MIWNKLRTVLLFAFAVTLCCDASFAQRGGDRGGRGGGDRGGDRGGRGDFGGRPSFGGESGGRPSFGGGRPSFGGGRPSSGGESGGRPSFGGGRPSFGGGSSGGGFDPAEMTRRVVGRFDRNQNGRIDEDEFNNIPEQYRGFMQSRGINIQPGSSIDELGESASRAFGNRDGGGEDGDRRGDDQNSQPRLEAFRPRDREPMTFELPPSYNAYDLDYDGQLAFHEWLSLNRQDLDKFDQMDANKDGFLTPLEIIDSESASDAVLTTFSKERLTIIDAAPPRRDSGRRGESRRGDDRSGGGDSGGSEDEQRAKTYFGYLDRDGDGTISSEEFQRSRRVRGMFEAAGVEMRDMSESDFVRTYAKVAAGGGR